MKKLLFIILTTFFLSCNFFNEKLHCYQCEITSATQIRSSDCEIKTVRSERCDVSAKEIRDFEKLNTYVAPVQPGNYSLSTGIIWSKCKFKRDEIIIRPLE